MDNISQVPNDLKQLRACMICSLIKTYAQFKAFGCSNCEEFLHMKSDDNKIEDCTSSTFEGTITLLDPDASWVARWQKISGTFALITGKITTIGKAYCKGIYAISVNGRPPPEIIQDMASANKRYRSRAQ
eukprot:TRINITY_DN3081_c1_g1_i1.p1 TRINITY_DN3081_c1_g1~~TRINITY_DN3081_c1_g1_i1.p1  ORF type:complete len:130 (-),score=6.31 TRINITY_DN3081_c1_g1_i1:39-428(-)